MPKILVVENDPGIRAEVKYWLNFEGYEVIEAGSGQIGLEIVKRDYPDLVIADIMMPQMDGYQFLIELRMRPEMASVPVIFITSRDSREDVRRGMELGADDYLSKPFSHQELIQTVNTRLNRSAIATQQIRSYVKTIQLLTRNLPHELRTPLIGIIGFGDLLAEHAESLSPAEIREFAIDIVSSGYRLNKLIEKFLFYAQIEMNTADPQKRIAYQSSLCSDPSRIARETCMELARKYSRADDLNLNLVDDAPVQITGKDFERIVQEILDNAFKFSESGSCVQVTSAINPAVYTFQVIDQGRGLQPEELIAIEHHKPFAQFEQEVREQSGAGLGLVISKKLIEFYQGSFHILSEPNSGVQIMVQLPLAKP